MDVLRFVEGVIAGLIRLALWLVRTLWRFCRAFAAGAVSRRSPVTRLLVAAGLFVIAVYALRIGLEAWDDSRATR